MKTIKLMRARRKLWDAGRYLEMRFNSAEYAGELGALERIALYEAIMVLANLYNGFVAN